MTTPERNPQLHQTNLTVFLKSKKRKPTSPKARSPSSINASPQKRANVIEESNNPKLEINPHELNPSIITPQRDKQSPSKDQLMGLTTSMSIDIETTEEDIGKDGLRSATFTTETPNTDQGTAKDNTKVPATPQTKKKIKRKDNRGR